SHRERRRIVMPVPDDATNIGEEIEGLFIRDDDEGLFSRDIDGQLVRLDSPTEADYRKTVTVQIDGQPVTVPLAEPLKDADGNIVQDIEGRTTPRYTTIYDAAAKLYVKDVGDEAKIPIPTLCHQPHMTPVAVCRLCVVQIYGQKRGKRAAERKLLPACQHQVKEGMEVFTMNAEGTDGDRVRNTVKVLTELLAADHLKPAEPPSLEKELAPFNELGRMVERCHAVPARVALDVFSDPPPTAAANVGRRGLDTSSPVFNVDHSACILCERCIRGCDEVRGNQIIGRTGKGVTAGISFDLNDPMGSSGCVQCGECMVSCPTSAITFQPGARIQVSPGDKSKEVLSASELISDPLFAGIPPKFLLWQQGLVIRRKLKVGDVLFRQGDPGNTAFLIKSGRLAVKVDATQEGQAGGTKGRASKAGAAKAGMSFEVGPADLIFGEMACLSGAPRNGTVKAIEPGEVWELRRNVLDRLMRLPSLRQQIEGKYRARTLDVALQNLELFQGVDEAEFKRVVAFLRPRITFIHVTPGRDLFRQGDEADAMYFIRLGHVRVGVLKQGRETTVLSASPGSVLGEIGLLALSPDDLRRTVDEVDGMLKQKLDAAGDRLRDAIPAGLRMATCSALNFVELVRLNRMTFLEMIREFPVVRRRLVETSLARMRENLHADPLLAEYVAQGLQEGRSILTLDLDLCTRCDECTRGCVQKHGTHSHGVPVTRLLRDGLHFDHFLIATSCRSCADPHCMTGCPVDSIHRGKHLQIVIEDHCIGCGLCASNCPYGSIFMVPNQRDRHPIPDEHHPGQTILMAQPKAVACDLCDSANTRSSPAPACVSSCPHDAAHRMTGEELLQRVLEGADRKRR
ncbi:MAG: cyclic nucleotide-binding domain-containing protein, partial [Chthoniobacteraceae bacterium]